jgi:hypothetical protein
MRTFKTYILEKRFPSLSSQDEKQAEMLIHQLLKKYNTKEKVAKIKSLAHTRRVPIGKISTIDKSTNKKINVTVFIGKIKEPAYYKGFDIITRKYNIIVLNYIMALDPRHENNMINHLKHELRHATQQYKHAHKSYTKHLQGKKGFENEFFYYGAPHELDAQEAEVFHRLQETLQKAKNLPQPVRNIFIQKFKNSLLTFLKSPWENYDLNLLPFAFKNKVDMLDALSKSPKLWQRFKLKVKTFLDEIDKY